MPAVVRFPVDLCSGHGCFPPRPALAASSDVFIDGFQCVRMNDPWAVHCCTICHGGTQASGSTDAFADGIMIARVGDAISCGSTNANGSPDTIAN